MENLKNIPKPGEFYRHFKGNLYQILALAIHTETEEPLVIYQALYGEFQVFARPLAMFQEIAANGKKRFIKVSMKKSEQLLKESQKKEDRKENEEQEVEELSFHFKKNQNGDSKQEDEDIYKQMEKFYDADSYEDKLAYLLPLRGKLSDIMISNIAVSLDIAVPEGLKEEQFQSIISCLKTMKRYQRSRWR